MGFKADQRIANTNLTDTFDAWRINTNLVVTRMNAFANGEFQLSANSLNANTEFVVGGANNQPGIANVMVVNASNSDFTLSTNTTNITGATVTFSGASQVLNLSSANTWITSGNVTFTSSNTLITNVFFSNTTHVNIAGNTNVVGLNTSNTNLAGAINEIKVIADAGSGDALAFAIALG